MHDLLLEIHAAADEWRQRGAPCIPAIEREEWVVRYFEILVTGFAAQPPPSCEAVPKRRGRQKQSAAKNLLDDLLRRADQVLAFLDVRRKPPVTLVQAEVLFARRVPQIASTCCSPSFLLKGRTITLRACRAFMAAYPEPESREHCPGSDQPWMEVRAVRHET